MHYFFGDYLPPSGGRKVSLGGSREPWVELPGPRAGGKELRMRMRMQVLEELGAAELPLVTVWNKTDSCAQPEMVERLAEHRPSTVAVSAATGAPCSDNNVTLIHL